MVIFDSQTMKRFQIFFDLLLKWNQTINLISREESLDEIWKRHFLNCYSLCAFIQQDDIVIDLGSGGGFPSLVVAIGSQCSVYCVESDFKKCQFLQTVSRETSASATIIHQNINALNPIKSATIVTSRALATLQKLFEWVYSLYPQGIRCLFLKGASIYQEIKQAKMQWSFQYELHANGDQGFIVDVSNIKPR